ncbi:leucyl aminopeptidase family protein [Phenylobacterium sp. J426]|uniref:leucyl aminopeptidase family protein n=1 Tax=Phenylobacterium sp. J426 TaxID=2898439 RepID=UPI0021510509|nr:leucyl aminopeptidase family protein [Phenylobacterium sp. J426]MCR5873481.1 leucyl aminopeptidase family protein [Phenylobacterium sp. J426]
MSDVILEAWDGPIVPVHAVSESAAEALLAGDAYAAGLAKTSEFKGKAGQVLLVPGADGALAKVLFGVGPQTDAMAFRALPARLPAGAYRIEAAPEGLAVERIALAFALGSYRFDRYKARDGERPRLVCPGAELAEAKAVAHACALARDMVNTPANDMGPRQIETIAREIADQYGASLTVVEGEGLLEANYPAVHAVGRAAHPDRAPRMIELGWGKDGDPLVAIVGKGVVFDTGGLDIKPSAGMRLMKKDMGGAAHALALGRMLMAAQLPVRVAVLCPVVENAISGDAMRPGDVLATRLGLTVEVGNTDAEGRLILADALTRAGELAPALTIDLATLTGAARIALGPQVIPFYTEDDELAAQIAAAAEAEADPMWRMPLWKGYVEALESDVADLKNDPDAWAQAGSVTAALFLQKFAPAGADAGPWVHLDIFAWNPRARPGAPSGAEAQTIRALYRMIRERFA